MDVLITQAWSTSTFLQHRKNLLEEVFFSSFTVIHTEWASDSSYEEYGDNDNTFRMDTILISTKKIIHDTMPKYASHILVSAHPTFHTISMYNIKKMHFQTWTRVVENKKLNLISHQKN